MTRPYLDYQDDDQYKQPCQECGTILHEDICIEVYESITNPVDDSFVVCDDCSQDYKYEYKSKGYIGQGELDEIEEKLGQGETIGEAKKQMLFDDFWGYYSSKYYQKVLAKESKEYVKEWEQKKGYK
tara:strand:+ start:148 stop:528 length:381 start_codon:yes stop_codon:yes gene_type:complete